MIYIYALSCPESGAIRYIGKCKNLKSRLGAHLSKAKGFRTNHHSALWIRSLLNRGLKPIIAAVEVLNDDDDWQAAASAAIRKFRDEGCDLTNLTGGGDGFHDVHPEVLKKRGRSRSAYLADPANKARHLATAGASHSRPDARMNHSAGAKSAWRDPVKRAMMIEGMSTPEAIARRAAATKRRNSDPEFAERHRKTMKERAADPAWRERLKRARDIRWGKITTN